MATIPRGVRNNNPLNIRRSKDMWLGMRTKQTDKDFVQFCTKGFGYRAAFIILDKYYSVYGLRTIESIIKRWAPENENQTADYISAVVSSMVANGYVYRQDELLPSPIVGMATWCELARAMAMVECGKKYASLPTTWQDIVNGWKMAFA